MKGNSLSRRICSFALFLYALCAWKSDGSEWQDQYLSAQKALEDRNAQAALDFATQAVNFAFLEFSTNDMRHAQALSLLGAVQSLLKDTAAAKDSIAVSLKIRDQLGSTNDMDYARDLHQMMQLCQISKACAEAVMYGQNLVALLNRVDESNCLILAYAHYDLYKAHMGLLDLTKALSALEEAYTMATNCSDIDKTTLSLIQTDLGLANAMKNKKDNGLCLYEKGLNLQEQLWGKNDPRVQSGRGILEKLQKAERGD